MPIVDAHPHIYSPDRDAYPTIDEPWEPGEPASADDLKKMMDVVGVDRAVFIQTSTFYGHDNRYIMDSAKEHAEWACGVVTLDPDDESHIDLLEDGVKNSNIRGMRGTTDSMRRISSPNVYRLWTRAMELGIPVNCMVMDELDRVPEIERIAQDLGDLKIVIDHCFMLNTRQRTEETLQALELLAKLPNVYAKLTPGTHGSYRVYPFVDMHDPLKRVIGAFGPNRCVWGSNFPNALWSKGASYAQNLHLFVKELGLSLPDKADILGVTAMSLWFPQEHRREERIATEQQERTEREVIEAQEEDSGPAEDDEQATEQDARTAQVTNMADLINAEREAPVLDEAEAGELAAILDVASQLNAVLGVTDTEVAPATDEIVPEAQPEEEIGPEPLPDDKEKAGPKIKPWDGAVEPEETVSVNVEELLAAQNYTPIMTDEIGKIDESVVEGLVEIDAVDDVESQLKAAMESVDIEPGLSISVQDDSPVVEDGELNDIVPNETSEEHSFDVDALVAAHENSPIGVDEDEAATAEATINVDELLAAQENSLTGDGDVAEEELTIDVEALLAAQENSPSESGESAPAEEPAIDVEALLAAQANPPSDAGEPEPAEELSVNVDELMAVQNETATAGSEPNTEQQPNESPGGVSRKAADSQMDLSGILDMATRLNNMLESAEEIGSDIADLATDDEAS